MNRTAAAKPLRLSSKSNGGKKCFSVAADSPVINLIAMVVVVSLWLVANSAVASLRIGGRNALIEPLITSNVPTFTVR